jgi:molybdopterin converting factor small subunit
MSVEIQIPTPLRSFTGDRAEVAVDGAATVGEAMRRLVTDYPDLAPHLYGDDGVLRSFVNVFVNERDSRALDGPETPVASGDVLMIVPAIAGGAR